MRKMLLTPLMVCIAALLFVPFIPALYAERPTDVEGYWSVHIPQELPPPDVKLADGHMLLFGATTVDEWAGDIAGEGSSLQNVIFYSSGCMYAEGILTLYDCTVKGTSGTGNLVIRWSGKGTTALGPWTGKWVILKGTGDLENLHGQGTWCGTEPIYPIAGKIHFDP